MSWYIDRMLLASQDPVGIIISSIFSYSITFYIVRVVTNETSKFVKFEILGLRKETPVEMLQPSLFQVLNMMTRMFLTMGKT